MKKSMVGLISIAALAFPSAAQIILDVGNTGEIFDDGQGNFWSFGVTFNVPTSMSVTGFHIHADALPVTNNGIQSGMGMQINDAHGFDYYYELFEWTGPSFVSGTAPSNMSASQTIDATYALNLGDSVGEWSFSFYAAIANGQVTQWNNVVITLVPAPGTVAFFGVGGLVATRRRRA